MDGQLAYEIDLENAAYIVEPVRSTVKVRGSIVAMKKLFLPQISLMIPTRDHLMSGRCIGGVLDPDVESLLSHHAKTDDVLGGLCSISCDKTSKKSKHV